MDLLLVRHAIAYDRDEARWPDDRERPLTPEGRKQFRPAARGLSRFAGSVQAVLTSPLTRAVETAAILRNEADWPRAEIVPALEPGFPIDDLIAVVQGLGVDRAAFVGHDPGLSELASILLAGPDARTFLEFRKGSVACLTFDEVIGPGSATLRWLMPPKVLRALG